MVTLILLMRGNVPYVVICLGKITVVGDGIPVNAMFYVASGVNTVETKM